MQAFITLSTGGTLSRRLATLARPGVSSSFTCNPFSNRSNLLVPSSFLPTVSTPAATPLVSSYPRTLTTWSSGSLRATAARTTSIKTTALVSRSVKPSSSPLMFVSTRFTSSSAPRSSATATATARTASPAAAATDSAASSLGKKTLSHHEEMTKIRFSYNWWKEWTIIMTVFAITGSSSVYFVKPILKNVLHLEGSMQEGPWSYRLTYVCTTMPTYSITLLAIASLFGRRPYFQKVVLRMWSRFLPKKVLQRFQ